VTVNFCAMTLTFDLDRDGVKVNQRSRCLRRKPVNPEIVVRPVGHTHTHTRPIAVPRPLKWSVHIMIDAVAF